jgi:hypothetical protein
LLPVGITTKLAALMAVAPSVLMDTPERGHLLSLEGLSK